jgi:hypothetical protein
MVEFAELSNFDLSQHRNVAAARGTLGVITLNNDVFICVVTGSVEVAIVRPGETVQRIYSVEFYCLNRGDYDHGHGHLPNPYPGQTFQSDEFDYGGGFDSGETLAEHPFHALQKLLSGGNFYYSVDFDLTRRLQDRAEDNNLDIGSLDEGLLWNSYMINPLLQFRSRLTHHERDALDSSRILTSVIRGFARSLTVPPSSSPIRQKASHLPATITVISRLSSRRAGTRFNSRGIDDNGNVANFVETETIFYCPAPNALCFSYVQVRGSVPVFWESSSSLIPGQQKISITRSPEATQPSFDKHFAGLESAYGAVHIVNLLSNSKPGELDLTARYKEHIRRSPLRRTDPNELEDHNLLRATEFDFHEYARGSAGYDVAAAIRPLVDLSSESFVYFLSQDLEEWTTQHGRPKKLSRNAVIMQQNGVFRVNCLDCLDRTNLVQGMISKMALELFLTHRAERANGDFWMRHDTLWADNGDALSKIYAGTGALKSSFTRHGKMSLGGALADVRKSATRLYVNHFEDKGRQNTVDMLLGRLVGQSSVDLFDPVNDWVVNELSKRRVEFESRSSVRVFVGTFNLNGKTGGTREDLSAWLRPDDGGRGFDIVVVGFQEIVELSPQQIMSTDPNRRMVWESAVRACLNGTAGSEKASQAQTDGDDYVLLRSGQLVGAALLVFVRASMLDRVSNVEGAIKKTGMSGIAGNKGAVACRMDIDSTSFCFVTAHLAAGFGNYDERNRDYHTISSGLHFQRERGIDDHEVIFWAGDFNYRVGLSYDAARNLVQQALGANQGAKREEALGKLYENDQLNIQMVAGNVFDFYREGKVNFLPTYKYDIGRDEFDSSEKARIPAWTDRVLYKVNHRHSVSGGGGEELGTKVKLERYDSVQRIRVSDHRPVFALFEVGVRVVDEAKKDALTRKLYAKRAREIKVAVDDVDNGGSDADSDDLEDVVGYEPIQEGLPPASSDRRKWWLDAEKSVAANVQLPSDGKGVMLNPRRPANPWRNTDGAADEGEAEEDWVKVEALASEKNTGSPRQKPAPPPPRQRNVSAASTPDGLNANANANANGNANTNPTGASARQRPTPPPSRHPSTASRVTSTSATATAPHPPKRMLPPVWAGPRIPSSSSSIAPSATAPAPAPALPTRPTHNGSGTPVRPSAPPSSITDAQEQDQPPPMPPRRTASSASSASTSTTVLRKPPPPGRPTKPSALAGGANVFGPASPNVAAAASPSAPSESMRGGDGLRSVSATTVPAADQSVSAVGPGPGQGPPVLKPLVKQRKGSYFSNNSGGGGDATALERNFSGAGAGDAPLYMRELEPVPLQDTGTGEGSGDRGVSAGISAGGSGISGGSAGLSAGRAGSGGSGMGGGGMGMANGKGKIKPELPGRKPSFSVGVGGNVTRGGGGVVGRDGGGATAVGSATGLMDRDEAESGGALGGWEVLTPSTAKSR